MHVGLVRRVVTLTGLVTVVGLAGCDSMRRVSVPGDVKDAEGESISGCTVELILQKPVSENWTGVRTREASTDAEARSRFAVFAGFASHYRLRIRHPGYGEWAFDGH